MADDRVIHCLFERKHRSSNHCSLPLEENPHKKKKYKHIRKHKHGTPDSPKETSYIENDHISKMYMQWQKRNKYKKVNNKLLHSKDIMTFFPLILNSMGGLILASHYSTPEIPSTRAIVARKICSNTTPFKSNFIVNHCCCDNKSRWGPIKSPGKQAQVYRCQTSSRQVCCCNCNSDAMFEVMKSLYDCYKGKNCDNCKCVLCGPKFRVETVSRAIGVGERGMDDVYAELEGKTLSQKEIILKKMAGEGYQLPKGRSPSEEAIIIQVKRSIGVMTPKMPSEKIRRARAAGLLTPLRGKSPREKERILRELADKGMPLPLAQTPSEKRLISKVRRDMGLPPEPLTKSERQRMAKAYADGVITPLEGKTRVQKEQVLRRMAEAGVPLPEGRTPSERDLIEKVKKTTRRVPSKLRIPSAKVRRAKEEGLLTPLEGKTHAEKERILKGLAKMGIPLPEAKTYSEKKLVDDVRRDLGLPPEPRTDSEKRRMAKAYAAGIVTPLEGKTRAQKEEVLRKMAEAGVPLPEGRTASERSLIEKVKQTTRRLPSEIEVPSEKIRKAKAEGILTPLEGKRPEEKERILRGLAKTGIPLPEGKTTSERKLINKIRREMGLPREPQTEAEKRKMAKAYAAGIITPLEGKTKAQKGQILRRMAEAGVPLPEGRTASETAIINKIKTEIPKVPEDKLRRARTEGFLTPLEGKAPTERERILKGLAKAGIPLPVGKTASEKRIIQKVRRDLGLPPVPRTESEKIRISRAFAEGIITPLEGKSHAEKEKILRKMAAAGVPLPEGRTSSERALIEKVRQSVDMAPKVPSEKIRKAKAEGILTPLEGKRPEEKERILRGLAKTGIPLPEGKTTSERKLINKIRREMGLPHEPQTEAEKRKMTKAYAAGIITPLEGKTKAQKEQILRRMAEAGVPLPEGRTASEKAIINKIKTEIPRVPEDKLRRARTEGFLTPLEGKAPTEKERILKGLAKAGIPLPVRKTASEKRIIQKVRRDLGLPPVPRTESEKMRISRAFAEGIITPLEGKSHAEKENILRKMAAAGVPLPEGRTSSERALIEKVRQSVDMAPKVPSEKVRKARAAGLLTPLEGKSEREKEKILRGLAKAGMPLPAATTPSESRLIEKVRRDLGLPPKPKTRAEKNRMAKAFADGIITPLEGKSPQEKERVLRRMAEAGVPMPEGRTPSERDLIEKVKITTRRKPSEVEIPSEKLRRVKAEGLLTPLEGNTHGEKERILRGLAKSGMPLPQARTQSERDLIENIRKDLGLPPEPQTEVEKRKMAKAYATGILTPLEGKTTEQKERVLRKMAEAGIQLPEGRTASEKELVKKIKAEIPRIPTDRLQRVQAEGLMTPLEGKPTQEKERLLRGLAVHGVPLPEGKTSSERKLIQNIRRDLGLPPEPKTPSEKVRLSRAFAAGIITPLEGKFASEKERVLHRMAAAGVPMPEGRTSSERALIAKVIKEAGRPKKTPSERLRVAKTAGLLTPLHGKSPRDRERILRGLAKQGLPLPEGKTASEKRIIAKVRKDMRLPAKPDTESEKIRLHKAYVEGIITPLEGKTHEEKERALRRMAEAGVPLPEAQTASERALIDKVLATTARVPTEKLRKAKAEGLLTPLEGKTREQKEQILRGLAKAGVPLPEGRTQSEKNLIQKIRKDLGLPPPPQTSSERKMMNKAYAAGIITPLEGKTYAQKEKALRKMAEAGIPLPEGRTASERALVNKVKATTIRVPSEKLRRAKTEGWLTPLEGKRPQQKEEILRGMAKAGVPLPEGKTQSEKDLIKKVKRDMGIAEARTLSEEERLGKGYEKGLVTPLVGKTTLQKERALRKMAEAGVPLPEGRTASEKALIKKIRATVARVPSEKLRRAKEEGWLTSLEGKSPAEKERILRGLTKAGVPLPEGKTRSEKDLIRKVRRDMGLPPEATRSSEQLRVAKAYARGVITPLEGKKYSEKERALKRMAEAGVPLPEGRTASEKALIKKIRATVARVPSEKLRRAKEEGLLTPLEGKPPQEKERILRGLTKAGVPLPEGKTRSEKDLIRKVRRDMGLPPEATRSSEELRVAKAYARGVITPLEGKKYSEKERALKRMAEAGVPLPEGRTASEKALVKKIRATVARFPSEKLRRAKEEGWLTPLEGKSPAEKERILRGLTKAGVPLPEGKTRSEKDLVQKVRRDMGLPPEATRSSEQLRIAKAYARGVVTPLEGKKYSEKERALKRMAEAGVPLPEGRTASERALIKKIRATVVRVPSEKLRRAKEEGLLTPLEGKPRQEKERILKGLAKAGVPLPEGKTRSEKDLIRKVKRDMGLPTEPIRSSEQLRIAKAYAQGVITPLEGKRYSEKERVLKRMAEAGVPLPEGRTASEKALIAKVKATTPRIPATRLRKAKEEGLLTPLQGKPEHEKERILRGLAKTGVPLPEGKTVSERKLIDRVRKEMGLPPEPVSATEKVKLSRAYAAGIITPLEGKTQSEKEQILRNMVDAGVPLPEARTASERALINKVIKEQYRTSLPKISSEKLRKARAAGLLTPLEGKTHKEREKILRKIAKAGLPLPKAHTSSEQKVIDKVRRDLALPPEPKTSSEKVLLAKQYAAGVITPLAGKSKKQKEIALRKMAKAGLPLPEGRTPSERALVEEVKKRPVKVREALPSDRRRKLDKATEKVIKETKGPSDECICDLLTPDTEKVFRVLSGKLRAAKVEGLLTPLEGKSTEQKERILRKLAERGLPLPEGKTASDKRLADKVKRDMGLPIEPETLSEKLKLEKAYAAGIVEPLEGKSRQEKEKILRKMAKAEIPLPEGRTASERAIIDKVLTTIHKVPSERFHRAKAEGLLTPLKGKTREQKEKILRGLAKAGLPFPRLKTQSEKDLANKVRTDLGLPPKPKTRRDKQVMAKAYADGIITPLEGKSTAEKERVLRKMAEARVPLPEGRTASERALIAKIKAKTPRVPAEKLHRAKTEGWLTPLEGKSLEQKENILRGLAKTGMPLPEGKTSSERRLVEKVRREMGLPPEPTSPSEKVKLSRAYAAGIVTPLEGKSHSEKERVLRRMAAEGISLPVGRTNSEKALINEIRKEAERDAVLQRMASDKIRAIKAEGLLSPLQGKTKEEKEKILRGLAKAGVPLPEASTPSERILIDKVRREIGLPPEPLTSFEKKKMAKAYAAGLITPIEGKSAAQKEKAVRKMAKAGIPLPEGRTASERALIAKVRASLLEKVPSEKLRRARTEGFLTPLKGKGAAERERILRGLTKAGIPLPEGKTASEKRIIQKVRRDMGMPHEPVTSAEKHKMKKAYAAGLITPLEGKTYAEKEKVYRRMAEAGISLPEGRTASERALIDNIRKTTVVAPPSDKIRAARTAGFLTPLEGKTAAQKKEILRGLAKGGLPLPEGKTPSERRLVQKVRKDMGLPPEPTSAAERQRINKAYATGIITPLEGKSHAEKERVLRQMIQAGVPLPEARTSSERDLIDKTKKTAVLAPPSDKIRAARAAGLLTPLEGKTAAEKEEILRGLAKGGLPLPEGKTPSERRLIQKVRRDMGLPPEPTSAAEQQKINKAYAAGVITPLEGKSHAEKERVLRQMAQAGLPLPEARTSSERDLIDKIKKTAVLAPPSDKIRAARAAGLLTPLEGKTAAEKEEILRGLAKGGLPLPEGKTPSQRRLIQKVRKDMGLPPEPTSAAERQRINKAYATGIITPLEGKSHAEKERVLRQMIQAGVPLPEARTSSERDLIDKIKKTAVLAPPSDKIRAARAAGLPSPLEGKTAAEKEEILRGLAKGGLPLPEGKTLSQRRLIQKVRRDMGLPPEPISAAERQKINKAYAAGIITPLEGKSHAEKERVLRKMIQAGVPLPEARTSSERDLIDKIKKTAVLAPPSDKIRAARAAGLLTPLEGKTAAEKEEILRGLAKGGLPLPEGKTPSERRLIHKLRRDMGLPPEPTSAAERQKINKAYAAGIITPLEGKSHAEKERVLRQMAQAGVPLPEARTSSERDLIDKIKKTAVLAPPSDKIRAARAAGLLTPLEGKTAGEKEEILRGLAKGRMPLPEGRTPSETRLIQKVRKHMGLPPEPTSFAERQRINKAYAAGIITPLEGKSHAEKERILRQMAQTGVPLPQGRTSSEKDLIDKIKKTVAVAPPSDKLRAARAAGFLTPLEGKAPEEKERILKGLARAGVPLPEGRTASERKMIQNVRKQLALPPEPKTSSERIRMANAYANGIITPLDGKSRSQKERVLRKMVEAGVPLPEGRTESERKLIDSIKAEVGPKFFRTPSEKIKRAKSLGLLTPLQGKTDTDKERILRGLAREGLPLPKGKTPSEKVLIDKVLRDMGLPPKPQTPSERRKYEKAYAAGIITPLEGKTREEKETVLRKMVEAGIEMPEGRTASERSLINKVRKQVRGKPVTRGVGVREERSRYGITEDIQEIEKTTKCDQACGCDRKKIRFKHSYIKIRVTSPDISSFCSCPDECIPGVKGGVFVDNEGIKVTVGRATGTPSYTPSSGSIRTPLSVSSLEFSQSSESSIMATISDNYVHSVTNMTDVLSNAIFDLYQSNSLVKSRLTHSISFGDNDIYKEENMRDKDNYVSTNHIDMNFQDSNHNIQSESTTDVKHSQGDTTDQRADEVSKTTIYSQGDLYDYKSKHETNIGIKKITPDAKSLVDLLSPRSFVTNSSSYDSIIILLTDSSSSSYIDELGTISILSLESQSRSYLTRKRISNYLQDIRQESERFKRLVDYTVATNKSNTYSKIQDYYMKDSSYKISQTNNSRFCNSKTKRVDEKMETFTKDTRICADSAFYKSLKEILSLRELTDTSSICVIMSSDDAISTTSTSVALSPLIAIKECRSPNHTKVKSGHRESLPRRTEDTTTSTSYHKENKDKYRKSRRNAFNKSTNIKMERDKMILQNNVSTSFAEADRGFETNKSHKVESRRNKNRYISCDQYSSPTKYVKSKHQINACVQGLDIQVKKGLQRKETLIKFTKKARSPEHGSHTINKLKKLIYTDEIDTGSSIMVLEGMGTTDKPFCCRQLRKHRKEQIPDINILKAMREEPSLKDLDCNYRSQNYGTDDLSCNMQPTDIKTNKYQDHAEQVKLCKHCNPQYEVKETSKQSSKNRPKDSMVGVPSSRSAYPVLTDAAMQCSHKDACCVCKVDDFGVIVIDLKENKEKSCETQCRGAGHINQINEEFIRTYDRSPHQSPDPSTGGYRTLGAQTRGQQIAPRTYQAGKKKDVDCQCPIHPLHGGIYGTQQTQTRGGYNTTPNSPGRMQYQGSPYDPTYRGFPTGQSQTLRNYGQNTTNYKPCNCVHSPNRQQQKTHATGTYAGTPAPYGPTIIREIGVGPDNATFIPCKFKQSNRSPCQSNLIPSEPTQTKDTCFGTGSPVPPSASKVDCVCPEDDLIYTYDDLYWMDKKDIMKLKSDWAQAKTAGFKFQMTPKAVEADMSVEEAIQYYKRMAEVSAQEQCKCDPTQKYQQPMPTQTMGTRPCPQLTRGGQQYHQPMTAEPYAQPTFGGPMSQPPLLAPKPQTRTYGTRPPRRFQDSVTCECGPQLPNAADIRAYPASELLPSAVFLATSATSGLSVSVRRKGCVSPGFNNLYCYETLAVSDTDKPLSTSRAVTSLSAVSSFFEIESNSSSLLYKSYY